MSFGVNDSYVETTYICIESIESTLSSREVFNDTHASWSSMVSGVQVEDSIGGLVGSSQPIDKD
jgi:hypothetical protein